LPSFDNILTLGWHSLAAKATFVLSLSKDGRELL
jgi:hypothetical protein